MAAWPVTTGERRLLPVTGLPVIPLVLILHGIAGGFHCDPAGQVLGDLLPAGSRPHLLLRHCRPRFTGPAAKLCLEPDASSRGPAGNRRACTPAVGPGALVLLPALQQPAGGGRRKAAAGSPG
ncbi:MAG: hypothetical protein EXS58_17605 [Candidatus Latescibacteria bacterium]|nr:hypothetical protein [Candidatus Latescibacterota bacterium]